MGGGEVARDKGSGRGEPVQIMYDAQLRGLEYLTMYLLSLLILIPSHKQFVHRHLQFHSGALQVRHMSGAWRMF